MREMSFFYCEGIYQMYSIIKGIIDSGGKLKYPDLLIMLWEVMKIRYMCSFG